MSMPRKDALKKLHSEYGVRPEEAARAIEISDQYGHKALSWDKGIVDVYSRLVDGVRRYIVTSSQKDFRTERKVPVASGSPRRYTSVHNKESTTRRRPTMARGKTATAEPEEVEETGEKDYTAYAGKEPTATMADFAEWLELEVFGGEYPGTNKEKDAFVDGVRLGGTLRMEFQRSEFNQERRAARRAERASGSEDSEEEAPAKKPAPARKTPAKAAAAPKPAAPKRRGKPAADAEAPY